MKKNLLIILLLFLSCSCSKTSITDSWKDPSYHHGPIKSLLVIGVGKDQLTRRSFEESFVMALNQAGVKALASYRYLAEDAPMDKKNIADLINKEDIEAVLITYLVDIKEEKKYHPPETYVTPRPGPGFYGYYYRAYDVVHQPGYYTTRLKVTLETTVYQAETEKPVWMARSQTMNPDSAGEVVKSVIPKLVKAMKADGLLPG